MLNLKISGVYFSEILFQVEYLYKIFNAMHYMQFEVKLKIKYAYIVAVTIMDFKFLQF